jgi:hypothetical protein
MTDEDKLQHAERLLKLRQDIAAEYGLDISDWRVRRLSLLTAIYAPASRIKRLPAGRSISPICCPWIATLPKYVQS